MKRSHADRLLELAKDRGIIRPRDLEPHGIPRTYLSRLTERGELVRLGRGLYQHADHDVTAEHSLAEAAKRVPHGVICLLSALRFHGLTTQNPFGVWIAIGPKDHEPKTERLALQVVRMSGAARTASIQEHTIEKVRVRVYSPAKTVADCFKFRNKIGLDVGIEALKEYHRQQTDSVDELWRCADVCRVQSVIRPYMEAIV